MITFIADFFMLCIFIEIQACENKPISNCLKIFKISRKKRKKIGVFFFSKDKKLSFRIYTVTDFLSNKKFLAQNYKKKPRVH